MKRRTDTFLRGSAVLAVSAVIAKVCGALLRIPLTALLGGTGMGYFSTAYGLFLPLYAVLVTGISTAVAQPVAARVGRGDIAGAYYIRRVARLLFLGTGLLGSAGALGFAGIFTRVSSGTMDAYPAVVSITPAVLLCSLTAVERGCMEGLCNMKPTAVSQAAEALVKLLTGLWLCRVFMMDPPAFLQNATPEAAGACGAVLGVTISALAGYLCTFFWKMPLPDPAVKCLHPRAGKILREIIGILLPAAIGALVTNLTSLIDLVTVMRLLPAGEDPAFVYGSFMGLAVTVSALIPSLTNMLAKSVLPCAAQAWSRGDAQETAGYARQVLCLTGLCSIPAGCGLFALARGSLEFLFAGREAEIAAASDSLRDLTPGIVFLCLSFPVFSLMQAIRRADLPVKLMLPGAAVKLAGNLLLVPRIGIRGAAISTTLCYAVILIPALVMMGRLLGVKLKHWRLLFPQIFGGILCGISAWLVYGYLGNFPQRIAFLLAVLSGGGVYILVLLLMQEKELREMLHLP